MFNANGVPSFRSRSPTVVVFGLYVVTSSLRVQASKTYRVVALGYGLIKLSSQC